MKSMRPLALFRSFCLFLAFGGGSGSGGGLIGLTCAWQGQRRGPILSTTPSVLATQQKKKKTPLPPTAKETVNVNDDDDDDNTDSRARLSFKARPSEMQQRAGAIASSFAMTDSFQPWGWTTNNHVQTIGGFLLRDTAAAFVPRDDPMGAALRIVQAIASKISNQQQQRDQEESRRRPKFWNVRERIETPDGDWFHTDTLFPTRSTPSSSSSSSCNTTVLLLHGLESNSDSALSQQMAAALAAQGMTVTCLNFRSCSQNEAGEFIPNDSLGGCKLLLNYL
jgi:hypothetical protein